jgi:hypothetical protein
MNLGSDPSVSSLLLPLSFGDLSYPQSRLYHGILSNNSSIKTSLIEEAMYVVESKVPFTAVFHTALKTSTTTSFIYILPLWQLVRQVDVNL